MFRVKPNIPERKGSQLAIIFLHWVEVLLMFPVLENEKNALAGRLLFPLCVIRLLFSSSSSTKKICDRCHHSSVQFCTMKIRCIENLCFWKEFG